MFREDPRIGWTDFAARMPVTRPPCVLDTVLTFQAMAMRQWRFRLQAACPAWTQRDASINMQAQIERLVPRQFLEANSTRGFRDLTSVEQEVVRSNGKKRPRKRRNRQGRVQTGEAARARNTRAARLRNQSQPRGVSEMSAEDEVDIYNQVIHASDSEEWHDQDYYPMLDIAATEQRHHSLARRHKIPLAAPELLPPPFDPVFTEQHTAPLDIPALPLHVTHSIAGSYIQELLRPTPAVDFREVNPSTPAQQAIVDDALSYTLDHFLTRFHDLTGYRHCAMTFPGNCYRDAYEKYVKLWEDAWTMKENTGEPVPHLRSVGPMGWCNKFPRVDYGKVRFDWDVCEHGYVLPPWHVSQSQPEASGGGFSALSG